MKREELKSLIGVIITVLIGGGLAWAGSSNSVLLGSIPLFALGIGYAFLIQWLAFIPAYIFQTEKFYDLTGSITYISLVSLSLVLSGNFTFRAVLIAALVLIWAGRLGSFLFRRVISSGKDDRFDEIKPSFLRFLLTWTLQGLWISFTVAAALAGITSLKEVAAIDGLLIVGLLIWVFGFVFEVVSDSQKNNFRKDPVNKGKFIKTGLWSISRHPNYFGEITLWLGIAIMAIPSLTGWQWVVMISPVFVALLITKISGVPLLEKKADARWGGQTEYEAYKAATPVLLPKIKK